MLKILMKLAGAVMKLAAIASCKEKEDLGLANVGVSAETVTIGKEGGRQTIKLLCNREWEALITYSDEEDDTWLTVNPGSGSGSNDSLSVEIQAVPNGGEDRYATITFNAGALSAKVSVAQPGEMAKQYDAIADVRALYEGENVTIEENLTVCGTVISNYRHEENGGLNNATSQKTLVIQDETAGISLYLAESNKDIALGDRVEVKVNGLVLQRYENGSLQIDNVPMDRINKIAEGAQVEPKTITASELVSGEYESQYVAVTDVQVAESNKGDKFVSQDYDTGENRHTSLTFLSKYGVRLLLFSSKYSTYGEETVPDGSGTLKGIAAVHGADYQISITSTDDYAGLTGARFGDEGFIKPQPTKATIQQVLDAPVNGYVWYEVTGTITNIASTQYGNFTMEDESGASIYVYGLTSEWLADGGNDKSFSSLGLSTGDVLTLAGVRDEYDGVPQIGGTAYYISHEEGQGGGEPEELKEASIEEFLNADPSGGIWYKLTGKVDDIYSTEYGNFWLLDESDNSIKVRVHGLTATRQDSNDKSFSSIGINEGDIITIATLRAEYNGEAQAGGTPPAYIIEGGSGGDEPDDPTIKKVSVDEFLKASVSGSVWYQLTGEITDLYNTSYGNFTLVDGTGSVLVYGLTKEKVSSNDQSFPELGLKEGDIVTLVGTRDEYNGKAQVGGPAYYISHEEGETPDVPEGDPTALIISEYVEGSSFNKYIEIANISDKTVDLASYSLVLYSNGNTSPQTTVALKGTLEPGAVKVYNGEEAALALPAGVESELNLAVNFNGDDAIVLTCNGENADVVGYIGEKIEWGKDKTFRRKTTVTAPTTEFNIDEWEQSSKDDVSGLGSF